MDRETKEVLQGAVIGLIIVAVTIGILLLMGYTGKIG